MDALAKIGDSVKATQFIGQSSGLYSCTFDFLFAIKYVFWFKIPVGFLGLERVIHST